jgi:uncharacterized protein YjaZ
MWFDELHHSERTGKLLTHLEITIANDLLAEIIAEHFVPVAYGKSPYATTYSGAH